MKGFRKSKISLYKKIVAFGKKEIIRAKDENFLSRSRSGKDGNDTL